MFKQIFEKSLFLYHAIEYKFFLFVKRLLVVFKKISFYCIVFLIGVAFASFMFFSNIYINVNPIIILILSITFLFLVGTSYFLYKKYKQETNAKILLGISLFLLGFTYYSFAYLRLELSVLSNFANHENVVMEGYVASDTRISGNTIMFAYKPQKIYFANQRRTIKDKQSNILVQVPVNMINSPYYRDWMRITGDIKSLTKANRKQNFYTGFKTDVVAKIDNISNIEYISSYKNSWVWSMSTLFREKLDFLLKNNLSNREKGLLYWLLFNNLDGISTYIKTDLVKSNVLSILINSKFYIIFTVLVFLFFSRSLGVKRKFLYIFSIPFIISIGMGYNFSSSYISTALVFLMYLLTGSHYRSIKISIFSMSWALFFILFFDPFVLTDKWFLSFLIMFSISTCFTRKVKSILDVWLRGWTLWAIIVVLFMMLTTSTIDVWYKNIFFRQVTMQLMFVILILATFIQSKLKWTTLNFNSIPEKIKLFFSWIITFYVFALLPISTYLTLPIPVGHFLLSIPLIMCFMLVIQFGYIGYLLGVIIYIFLGKFPLAAYTNFINSNIKWLVRSIDFLIDKQEAMSPARFVCLLKNNIMYLLLFYLLVIALYYSYINRIFIKNYFFKGLDYVKVQKLYLKILSILTIVLIIVGSIIFRQAQAKVLMFSDNTANYFYIKTPQGKKVIISDFLSFKDEDCNSNVSGLSLFLNHGITRVDTWIFLNIRNNYEGFSNFLELSEYIRVKNIIFNGSGFSFSRDMSYDEFIKINDLQGTLNNVKLYSLLYTFYYRNSILNFDEFKPINLFSLEKIVSNWNMIKNREIQEVYIKEKEKAFMYKEDNGFNIQYTNDNTMLEISFKDSKLIYNISNKNIGQSFKETGKPLVRIFKDLNVLNFKKLRKLNEKQVVLFNNFYDLDLSRKLFPMLNIFTYNHRGVSRLVLKADTIKIKGRKIY